MQRNLYAIATAATFLALAGCEQEGPLERAGEEADEALEDIRNGGETFGNQVDDAVDEARDEIEDAAEEIEEQVTN